MFIYFYRFNSLYFNNKYCLLKKNLLNSSLAILIGLKFIIIH